MLSIRRSTYSILPPVSADFACEFGIRLHALGEVFPFELGLVRQGDGAGDIVPQAVGVLHDVRLADRSHRLPLVLDGVIEGVVGDRPRAGHGDGFDGHAGAGGIGVDLFAFGEFVDRPDQASGFFLAGFELHAGVEVFGVLADQDDIDGDLLEKGPHAFVLFARPDAGIQAEFLAEEHVHAAKAFADGRGDRGFDRDIVLADGFQHAVRDAAFGFDDFDPAGLHVPVDFDAGGVDAFAGGLGDFRPDAVAGEQCHFIHGSSP